MRALLSLVFGLALVACADSPAPDSADPSPGPGAPVHTLTLPARYASSSDVDAYAELANGQANEETELIYGLGDGYPREVTLVPQDGYVLSSDCQMHPGPVVWKSITDVQGTAATVELVGGALAVELREEGTVTVLLEGEITGQHCPSGDGSIATALPLQHRLVLHVKRVVGFVVEQFHQQLAGCWDTMVLPSGAPLWAPTARPLDATGKPFSAINAPVPVALTLQSNGDLAPGPGATYLTAGPGSVTVSVDTTLPVQGMHAFQVVGPDALTSVDASFYLRKAALKGNVSEPIEEGASYELFLPEQSNGVDLHVDAAMTTHGKLCEHVPGAWFASASSTPTQCEANVGVVEPYASSTIPVAAIGDAGECRLSVTIPGTTHRWTTRFSIAP
ncbi:hypothetical protein [Polyangium jinanense]|uniref:Lipoprotein n=1 Tax=Polyangium jinanense TaxID=2829994 RepID=A0A9X3X515_9BACT|nr:hypothetical protein [Polyangium jinanense]MDC3959969.1 hypothetical protein [Polyangium jinanense]MDC3983849.1 hypothetical protein [Polyangium jinanense]